MSGLNREYLRQECKLLHEVAETVNKLHQLMNDEIEKHESSREWQLEVAMRAGMFSAIDGAIGNFKSLHDSAHAPAIVSDMIAQAFPQAMSN